MSESQREGQVEAVVEQVRGLAEEQARTFLDRLRLNDPELYEEVVIVLDSLTQSPRGGPLSDGNLMRAVLTVTAGSHAGSTFTCPAPDTFTFGRSRRARFLLSGDSAISSLHFMVTVQPLVCLVTDLASSHGTFVNGERIDMTVVDDGDEIKAGNSTFRILLEGAAGRQPPVPKDLRVSGCVVQGDSESTPLQPVPRQEPPTRGFRCLPGYELLEELGRGGMGVVYKGRRMADGETVAIKTIRPDRVPAEEDVRRFRREVELLKKLQHPHVVPCLEVGDTDGRLLLVMEYVSGGSLKEALDTTGPLPVARAVGLMCQVLEGLAYAHGEGVIHRDIKPGNVLVTALNGREVAKLADFGLARAYQSSGLARLTRTGQQMGTPVYMPREQVLDFRTVSPAGDQYSAAATLYHLLTGQLLYDGIKSLTDVFLGLLEERPAVRIEQRRPDLPSELAAAVHRALQHRPEERFSGVVEFRQVLLPFSEH
jgi:eukaryotic-like serine/threonine-protein kinase